VPSFCLPERVLGPVVFFAVGKISIKVQSSLLLCFWLFEKKLT
jgi:hypothetical protein